METNIISGLWNFVRLRKKLLLTLVLVGVTMILYSMTLLEVVIGNTYKVPRSMTVVKSTLALNTLTQESVSVQCDDDKLQVSINISKSHALNSTFILDLDVSKEDDLGKVRLTQQNQSLTTVVPELPQHLKDVRAPLTHIKCFRNLAAPFLAELKRLRAEIKEKGASSRHVFPELPLDRKKLTVLDATSKDYFSKLDTFDHIETVLFNASMAQVRSCMLKNFYPKFTLNNCSRVLKIAKRHAQYGKSLYGMSCSEKPEDSLEASPLHPATFNVGMPQNFIQGPNVKTVTYLHIVKDAIVTIDGDAISHNVHVIPQRCYPERRAFFKKPILRVVDEVFSIAQYFGSGVFHGNVEDVSRLALYMPFLQEHPNIKIHVKSDPPFFMKMFEFAPSRFVNDTIKAKILYMPAGTGCCLPNFITTQLESFYLRRSLPNLLLERDTIILVKRSMRRNRFFEQHDAILSMLQSVSSAHGLKVWEFRDDPVPPLRDIATKFNRAVMVVAPHGAGETNLLFSQPGLVLIEGLCYDYDDGKVNLVYRNMVHLIGGHYFGFYRPVKHCTHTTADELRGPVEYYLNSLYPKSSHT